MKVSELITHLTKAMDLEGDLEVCYHANVPNHENDDNKEFIAGVVTICDENEEPNYFLICDDNTLDMFSE